MSTRRELPNTSTTSTHRAVVALCIGVFTLFGCRAGGVRPFYNPFPEARSDTVLATPDAVIRALKELVLAEGIQLGRASEVEGYLESKWFDTADRSSMDDPGTNTSTRVRLRFWVDTFRDGQSVVIGEVVRRRVIDPSLPERELEILVDREHPADALAVRIMAELQTRLDSGGAN